MDDDEAGALMLGVMLALAALVGWLALLRG